MDIPAFRMPPDGSSTKDGHIRGQSLVEFTIALPALLWLTLAIIQMALLAHARATVEYAAFCAARAAVVHEDQPDRSRRAASIACMPLATTPPRGADHLQELRWPRGPASSLADITDLLQRYRDSYMRTNVRLHTDTRGDVTAEVTHAFQLTVPLAGRAAARVLSRGGPGKIEGENPVIEHEGLPSIPVRAICTLPAEPGASRRGNR